MTQSCSCPPAFHLAGLGRNCQRLVDGAPVVGGLGGEERGWGRICEEAHCLAEGSVEVQSLGTSRQVGFDSLTLGKGPVGWQENCYHLNAEMMFFARTFHNFCPGALQGRAALMS